MSDLPSAANGAGRRRHVTIEDVAAAAGVSVATVSRALRDLPNVAPATRLRVRAVAERLGYHADPHASRLAAGRTFTVAMAVPLVGRWYFSQVVAGAESVLSARGYDVLLYAVEDRTVLDRFLADARYRKRTDALVLVDIRLSAEEFTALHREGAPLVTIGPVDPRFCSVSIDDVAAARLAARHLVELGHHRLGLVGGHPDSPVHFEVPDQRRRGFLEACRRAGATVRPEHVADGHFSVEGGARAIDALLDGPEPPTAVFAASDEMAMGVVRRARERGLRVPGDLSVLGFDDHDLAAVFGLSTIRQPVRLHGERVAELVLEILDGSLTEPVHVVHDVEVVERETTGPPV